MMPKQTYSEPQTILEHDATLSSQATWDYERRIVTLSIVKKLNGEVVKRQHVADYDMDELPEPWATMRDNQDTAILNQAEATGKTPAGGTRE